MLYKPNLCYITANERFTQVDQHSRILVIQREELTEAIMSSPVRELLTRPVLRWQESRKDCILANIRKFLTDTRFTRKNKKAIPARQAVREPVDDEDRLIIN